MDTHPTLNLGAPAKLSTPEAAHYLGLSPSYLKKLRKAGEGPVLFAFGRRYIYRREDLDAYAAAHRIEPVAPVSSVEGGEA